MTTIGYIRAQPNWRIINHWDNRSPLSLIRSPIRDSNNIGIFLYSKLTNPELVAPVAEPRRTSLAGICLV